MQPLHFTTRPAFTVIGLLYRGGNKNNEIPQLWGALYPARAAEITGKVDPNTAYGVEDNFDMEAGVWDYLAGYEVAADASVPPGMTRKHIPAQTYAVFATTLPEIGKTMDAIHQGWMPTSGYRRADGPEFELYDEDFAPAMGKFGLTIYMPVEEVRR